MGFLFDNNVFFFAAIDASLVLLLTGAGGAAAMNADFSSPLPSDNTDEPVVLDVLLFFLISPRSDGITSGRGPFPPLFLFAISIATISCRRVGFHHSFRV